MVRNKEKIIVSRCECEGFLTPYMVYVPNSFNMTSRHIHGLTNANDYVRKVLARNGK